MKMSRISYNESGFKWYVFGEGVVARPTKTYKTKKSAERAMRNWKKKWLKNQPDAGEGGE